MTDPMEQLVEAHQAARRNLEPAADSFNFITTDAEGYPRGRIVTAREITLTHVSFTANSSSPKVLQLKGNGRYEAHFYWPRAFCQIRLRGDYRLEDPPELAQGWALRAYGGRIADLYESQCRDQSSVVSTRELLLSELAELRERYPPGASIPKPRAVVSVVLEPRYLEIWVGDAVDRLHDRRQYTRQGRGWHQEILVP